jgi:hypothetical protein
MALKKQKIMNIRPFRPSGYIAYIPIMASGIHQHHQQWTCTKVYARSDIPK